MGVWHFLRVKEAFILDFESDHLRYGTSIWLSKSAHLFLQRNWPPGYTPALEASRPANTFAARKLLFVALLDLFYQNLFATLSMVLFGAVAASALELVWIDHPSICTFSSRSERPRPLSTI